MKFCFTFLTIILLYSCDPDKKDIFTLEVVKVEATLENNNEIVYLGDTLKMKVQLPDIVIGNSGNVNIESLQKAQFFMYINRIDTVSNTAILIRQPAYWTIKGNISPSNIFDFQFKNDTKPFEVIIYFKPQNKGIYYLEILSQAGQIKLNNTYEARLIVNFNVSDKHLYLATPFFGSAWTNNAQTRDFGTYVFRVN